MKKWLVYGNIWVAINAAALTSLTEIVYLGELKLTSLFVFFSTISGYNIIRLLRLNKISSPHKKGLKAWVTKNKSKLWLLTILGLIIALIISLKFSLSLWLLCVAAFGITGFYSFPFVYGKGLRDLPFIKLFLIAAVWTFTSIALPLLYTNAPIATEEHFFAMSMGLFVIAITLPFDIRDIHSDDKSMRTIPQMFGIKWTKILAILMLVLAFYLLQFTNHYDALINAAAICFVITSALIIRASPQKPHAYFSVWIEAMPVVWLLNYIVIQQLFP